MRGGSFIQLIQDSALKLESTLGGRILTSIAASQWLKSEKLEDFFNYDEVINYSNTEEARHKKYYAYDQFGERPVTVFRGKNFFVDIYIWTEQDTSLHDHSFSGAFQILRGSAVQRRYRYNSKRINPQNHITEGSLIYQKTEKLTKGSICPINLGESFVHRVIHLEKPTVTICVRTYCLLDFQSAYSRSGRKLTYNNLKVSKKLVYLKGLRSEALKEEIAKISNLGEVYAINLFSGISHEQYALSDELKKYLQNICREELADFLDADDPLLSFLSRIKNF